MPAFPVFNSPFRAGDPEAELSDRRRPTAVCRSIGVRKREQQIGVLRPGSVQILGSRLGKVPPGECGQAQPGEGPRQDGMALPQPEMEPDRLHDDDHRDRERDAG